MRKEFETVLAVVFLAFVAFVLFFSPQEYTGQLIKSRAYPEATLVPTTITLDSTEVLRGGILGGVVSPGSKGSDIDLSIHTADGLRRQTYTFCRRSGQTCWEDKRFEVRLLFSIEPGDYYVEVRGKSGTARADFSVLEESYLKRSNEL